MHVFVIRFNKLASYVSFEQVSQHYAVSSNLLSTEIISVNFKGPVMKFITLDFIIFIERIDLKYISLINR